MKTKHKSATKWRVILALLKSKHYLIVTDNSYGVNANRSKMIKFMNRVIEDNKEEFSKIGIRLEMEVDDNFKEKLLKTDAGDSKEANEARDDLIEAIFKKK